MSRATHPRTVLLALLCFVTPASAQLYVRGAPTSLPDPIGSITPRGVALAGDAPRLIPWHRVKAVRGEHADDAEPYMPIAERTWRAVARLDRHDYALASPLFTVLFDERDAVAGPTRAVIARGLLACAVHSGDHLAALAPYIEALDAPPIDTPDPGVVPLDPATGLCPQLPPFWIRPIAPRAAGVLAESRPAENAAAPRARAIATLYLTAAADPESAGRGESAAIQYDLNDPAQRLLGAIVTSRVGSPQQRRGARAKLRRLIDENFDTWAEAWCRIALARSLLRDDDAVSAERAVIELLHVPSRFEDSDRLVELALAFACDALIDRGRIGLARTLRDRLAQRDHSAHTMQWIDRRLRDAEQTPTNRNEDSTT